MFSEAEKSPKYWTDKAQEELEDALRAEILNRNVAKNVIVFIGMKKFILVINNLI